MQAPGLLVGAAWETLLEGNVRTLIERERLLPFLQRQRWFGGKARKTRSARFVDWGVLRRGPQPIFLTLVEVEYEDGAARSVLPAADGLRVSRREGRGGARRRTPSSPRSPARERACCSTPGSTIASRTTLLDASRPSGAARRRAARCDQRQPDGGIRRASRT